MNPDGSNAQRLSDFYGDVETNLLNSDSAPH
jgi:hypothetical protein